MSKKVCSKDAIKKIKKIKDKIEKKEALVHSINSNLEIKIHRIEMDLKDLKKKEVDTFILNTKLDLLKNKFKYFKITLHKSDFQNVFKLFRELQKELNNL